jgi:hypothetical protein
MKECPNCAVEIADDATTCPICKYEFPHRSPFPWKPVAALLLVVILLPLLWRVIQTLSR